MINPDCRDTVDQLCMEKVRELEYIMDRIWNESDGASQKYMRYLRAQEAIVDFLFHREPPDS